MAPRNAFRCALVDRTRERRVTGRAEIQEIRGTLAGPLLATGVHYRDGRAGTQLRVARRTVDIEVLELLRRRLRIARFEAADVEVRVPAAMAGYPPTALPFEVHLDSGLLTRATVWRDDEPLARIVRIAVSGNSVARQAWRARGEFVNDRLLFEASQSPRGQTAGVSYRRAR